MPRIIPAPAPYAAIDFHAVRATIVAAFCRVFARHRAA